MSWILIFSIGVATYALRASFLLATGGGASEPLRRALRYVPVAVLPPLAISAVVHHGSGGLDLRLTAAGLAALVAWKTHNAAASMGAGMLLLWALLYLA